MAHELDAAMELDEYGYHVTSVPALPSCHNQARSLGQLMERVKEAFAVSTETEVVPDERLTFSGYRASPHGPSSSVKKIRVFRISMAKSARVALPGPPAWRWPRLGRRAAAPVRRQIAALQGYPSLPLNMKKALRQAHSDLKGNA